MFNKTIFIACSNHPTLSEEEGEAHRTIKGCRTTQKFHMYNLLSGLQGGEDGPGAEAAGAGGGGAEDRLGARQKALLLEMQLNLQKHNSPSGPCSENLVIRRKQQPNNCNNNKKLSPSGWGFCSDPVDCGEGIM